MTGQRVGGLREPLRKAGRGSLGDDEPPSECLGYHVSGRREGRGQGGGNGWSTMCTE